MEVTLKRKSRLTGEIQTRLVWADSLMETFDIADSWGASQATTPKGTFIKLKDRWLQTSKPANAAD